MLNLHRVERILILVFTHIHRCVLALYTQYFPEFCEEKKKSQASRVELKLDLLALKMCTEWREGKKTIIDKGFLVEHS